MFDFLPANNQRSARYAVDTYRIRFQTLDENNEIIEVRADVRFPRVDVPTQFPVFVYGSGTTGVGNDCATVDEQMRRRDWGQYRKHMLSYAAQGFITILPNWQGFDDPLRTHPYFVTELEGRVMLDAARAVYNFFRNPPAEEVQAQPSNDVFFGGYSQGGHGAFAADMMADEYAPELNIRGIIGHATSPDVEGLMYDSPRYAPYIVYAYRDFYGNEVVDPAEIFRANWLETFDDDVEVKCIEEVFRYYSDQPGGMYTPAFREALYSEELEEFFPAFKEKLDLNHAGREVDIDVPAIILHGGADPIVTPRTVERFVGTLCNSGKNVIYSLYPEANHFTTRQFSFVETLTWMQTILADETPEANCSEFFSNQFE